MLLSIGHDHSTTPRKTYFAERLPEFHILTANAGQAAHRPARPRRQVRQRVQCHLAIGTHRGDQARARWRRTSTPTRSAESRASSTSVRAWEMCRSTLSPTSRRLRAKSSATSASAACSSTSNASGVIAWPRYLRFAPILRAVPNDSCWATRIRRAARQAREVRPDNCCFSPWPQAFLIHLVYVNILAHVGCRKRTLTATPCVNAPPHGLPPR